MVTCKEVFSVMFEASPVHERLGGLPYGRPLGNNPVIDNLGPCQPLGVLQCAWCLNHVPHQPVHWLACVGRKVIPVWINQSAISVTVIRPIRDTNVLYLTNPRLYIIKQQFDNDTISASQLWSYITWTSHVICHLKLTDHKLLMLKEVIVFIYVGKLIFFDLVLKSKTKSSSVSHDQ